MPDLTTFSLSEQITALSVYGQVTPRLFDLLFRQFGSVEQVLLAETEDLQMVEGITATQAKTIAAAFSRLEASRDLLAAYAKREIDIVHRLEDRYPHRLHELNDPPLLLYCKGMLPRAEERLVTIVGPEASGNDRMTTVAALVRRLSAAGVSLVGTLRDPIGLTVHLTTQAAGGRSYHFADGGLDELAAESTRAVAVAITAAGAVLSELPPEARATTASMLSTNRLLVGAPNAVIFCALDGESARLNDLLAACNDIGKLAFLYRDNESDEAIDPAALSHAVALGVIPLTGADGFAAIVRSLV